MKMFQVTSRFCILAAIITLGACSSQMAQDSTATASGDKVPLVLKLPPPAFKGTPKDIPLNSYVEPLSDKPRPPMMVPPGLKNLALNSKLTSSDKNATLDILAKLIDGDKESSDQS